MKRLIALIALVAAAGCMDHTATPPAMEIHKSRGDGQTGTFGLPLIDSLEVRVRNAPPGGVTIRWEVLPHPDASSVNGGISACEPLTKNYSRPYGTSETDGEGRSRNNQRIPNAPEGGPISPPYDCEIEAWIEGERDLGTVVFTTTWRER